MWNIVSKHRFFACCLVKTLQAAFWLVCLESGKQRNEENMLFSTHSLQNSVNSGVLFFLLKAQTCAKFRVLGCFWPKIFDPQKQQQQQQQRVLMYRCVACACDRCGRTLPRSGVNNLELHATIIRHLSFHQALCTQHHSYHMPAWSRFLTSQFICELKDPKQYRTTVTRPALLSLFSVPSWKNVQPP